DRQKIERDQPSLGSNPPRKRGDDIGIRNVLLLRRRRHGKVVLDEPRDELRVVLRKRMLQTKSQRVARAEMGMIPSTPLRDIVEKSGEIKDFLVLEIGDETRAQRILVRMLRFGEAAQVANHHQNVLVDRVHVKQIVL